MIRTSMTVAGVLAACSGAPPTTNGSMVKPEGASQAQGLAAFDIMRSVFQHPRCQNCHPAGDAPLQGDEGHPHLQNVLRGPDGGGEVGERCTTCHGAANPPDSYGTHIPPGTAVGWRMPPPENKMVFVGASPHDLCVQIKTPEKNGHRDLAGLKHHLDDPLVTWGWHPGNGRAAIPVSRQDFDKAFKTWSLADAPCP